MEPLDLRSHLDDDGILALSRLELRDRDLGDWESLPRVEEIRALDCWSGSPPSASARWTSPRPR